jgi:hypothetical protein
MINPKYTIGIAATKNERYTLGNTISTLERDLHYYPLDGEVESIICLNNHDIETTDEAYKLVEKYPKLEIKVIESSPGLLNAQRKIILESKSLEDFVIFYDADIYIEKGSTKRLVSFMKNNSHVHAASGDQKTFDYNHFWYEVYNIIGLNPKLMTPRKYLIGKDFAIRKKSYFIPEFLLSEDTFLSYFLTSRFGKGAIANVPEVMVVYMGPKTFQDYLNKVRRLDLEKEKIFKKFPEFHELDEYFRKKRIPEEINKLSFKEKIQLVLHDIVLKGCKRISKLSKKHVWIPLNSTKDNRIFEDKKDERD